MRQAPYLIPMHPQQKIAKGTLGRNPSGSASGTICTHSVNKVKTNIVFFECLKTTSNVHNNYNNSHVWRLQLIKCLMDILI